MKQCVLGMFAAFWSVLSLSATAFAAEKPARFLFVQSAQAMTFADGTLTLQNVAPVTIFFSDRPKRVAGHLPTRAFIANWSKGTNSFKKDPPNATLSVFNPKAPVTVAVMELTDPNLEGGNLSFKVKMISGKLPAKAGENSLFIDAADGGCWAGYEMDQGPCWAREAFEPRY